MPNCRHIFDTPPKIFFKPTLNTQIHSPQKPNFTKVPPPLTFTKIINPAKWGYSPSQTTYRKSLFFESLQYISYLYITTKRGSGDNQIQKGVYTDSYGKEVSPPHGHPFPLMETAICEPTPVYGQAPPKGNPQTSCIARQH
jgi:hypothetical protein